MINLRYIAEKGENIKNVGYIFVTHNKSRLRITKGC